ncbi:MAG TPA: DUF3866 family protein, partial [Bacillota bacterium]|nr:DUF3866 family protein [Bacillota bacterium]
MIKLRSGLVSRVESNSDGVSTLVVVVDGEVAKAINYDFLTGSVQPGEKVLLNTTAEDLGLGSGGNHFVVGSQDRRWDSQADRQPSPRGSGHIIKLRYTPLQLKVMAVEEEDSPYRRDIEKFTSLKSTPVVVGTLHSQLAAAAMGAKKSSSGKLKIDYVMTDGAALPIQYSNQVRELKKLGLIDLTVTAGHAFGGDLEAVNMYTALIAAKEAGKADIIIVTMGPGIVGTGTQYGFTGVEQGEILNAAAILGGQPICLPRISFADPRERHTGISHHTLTVLEKIANQPCTLALPVVDGAKRHYIRRQLSDRGLFAKHEVEELAADDIIKELLRSGFKVTTMGRGVEEDLEFFLAAAAAGKLADSCMAFPGIRKADSG